MKLIEVTSVPYNMRSQHTQRGTLQSLSKKIDNFKSDPTHQYVGAGNNAYVHKRNDPHDRDRVYRTSHDLDGGAMWLKFVYESNSNNPFLPRVIELDNNNTAIPTLQVEKLVPFLSDKVQSHLKQQATNNYLTHQVPYIRLPEVLLDVLDQSVPIDSVIKDANLKQAFCMIWNACDINSNEFVTYKAGDINEDNIMWRMTQYGPQLVITDPIWGKMSDEAEHLPADQ